MVELKIEGNTYTEEEFQRDLKRYFDTLDEGQYPCKFYEECEKCMLHKNAVCDKHFVNAKPIEASFEIIEKVYRWAREHPYRTNEDYILETMGIELGLLTNDEIVEWLGEEYMEPDKDD